MMYMGKKLKIREKLNLVEIVNSEKISDRASI